METKQIKLERGKRYWIYFCKEIKQVKLLAIHKQDNTIVQYRFGPPIFGVTQTELASEFIRRFV